MLVFPNAKKLIRFIHFPLICPILLRILCASKESIKCCEKFTRGKIYLSFASLFSKAIQNCFACILLCFVYKSDLDLNYTHARDIHFSCVYIQLSTSKTVYVKIRWKKSRKNVCCAEWNVLNIWKNVTESRYKYKIYFLFVWSMVNHIQTNNKKKWNISNYEYDVWLSYYALSRKYFVFKI